MLDSVSAAGVPWRVPMDAQRDRPGALAIRAPNWVGDLVMATPVLEAAIASERWSRVDILVRRHLAPILADGPCAAHIAPVDTDRSEIAAYRKLAPDTVLLLSSSFGAAWRALRGGVRRRIGAALSGRRFLLTRAYVPPSRDGRRIAIPTAHLLRDVAHQAGIEVDDLHPRLHVREAIVRAENDMLRRLGIDHERGYVVCCPGAAFGAAKLWPPEHFAAALDRLCERSCARAVITGGPGEETLIDAVARRCTRPAISLAGEKRDLESLKALVRGARLLLVGDSGPRWFAAAFDVPCVSVMGPTDPELTASSLEWAEIVRLEGLECSPCLERRCPLEHHRCMRDLDPERVVAAAERLLARRAERPSA
jgi:heptosyltransferase-2